MLQWILTCNSEEKRKLRNVGCIHQENRKKDQRCKGYVCSFVLILEEFQSMFVMFVKRLVRSSMMSKVVQ